MSCQLIALQIHGEKSLLRLSEVDLKKAPFPRRQGDKGLNPDSILFVTRALEFRVTRVPNI